MKISISIEKSVEENAGIYFDKAKKYRKKIDGAKEALEESRKKLVKLEKKITEHKERERSLKAKKSRKKEWFEKFRWFYTSDGLLVIAGRDSTSNEIIIKKHTDKEDLVLHTDMAGSPFGVIKSDRKDIPERSKIEAGQFIACHSKAWKLGLSTMEVFAVTPDQVSKSAPSGEYIQKGSFMIYGRKDVFVAKLELWMGLDEKGRIIAGPAEAIRKHSKKLVKIMQGSSKKSEAAKLIRKKIGGDIDSIVSALPNGGVEVQL